MKRIIFFLFFAVVSSYQLFAQNIENGVWRCQNPNNRAQDELIVFRGSIFIASSKNFITGREEEIQGVFSLTENILVLSANGQTYEFLLTWLGTDQFGISSDGGRNHLIYSQANGPKDLFVPSTTYYDPNNYLNNYNYTTPSAPQTKKSVTCGACYGAGYCNVCKGTGQYSLYGNPSSTCTACGGTGKCWHCHGSGKQ